MRYNLPQGEGVQAAGGGSACNCPANAITDSMIAAQTSTKITITNKAQLNSQIAYMDAANWVTDAMVSPTAAIQKTKIALTGTITDSDISSSANIAKSKLAALNIGDADIVPHTTTKITVPNNMLVQITDKTKLPNDTTYTANTVTLQNKTFDSTNFLNNPQFTVQGSDPADPAAGFAELYFKTIDASNEGLFFKCKLNGAETIIQIT